jgi:tetratricopeptide (TPR) repeat protein
MKVSTALVVGLLVIAVVASCTKVKEATLERGINLFIANNLEEALKVLDASAKISSDNPDAHAWHAECLRRLKKFDESATAAYAALELDPEHSFAHTVLGDLFNPQYSSWRRTNADSTWFHLREAARYDPEDGNAWSALWVQSLNRPDRDIEHEAAVKMIDSGFLAGPVLAYNRWQLEHLPEDAILLTNGDMDTYPSAALRQKEGLRQDSALVNLSLLNLPWYAKLVEERYEIPLPPDFESLTVSKDREGKLLLVNKQIVAHWMELQQKGELPRPLCAAVTVSDLDFTPDARAKMVLCGPYFEIKPVPVESDADITRLGKSIAEIDAAGFEGSFTTLGDRSPVRRSMTDRIATNITAAMLRYVSLLMEQERWEEAESALAGAKEFDSGILASGHYAGYMETLGEEIAEHTSL